MAVIGVFILVIAICDIHGMPHVELRDVINDGPGNRVIGDVIDPFKPRHPWRPNNPSRPFGPIVASKRDAEDGGDNDLQELVDIIRPDVELRDVDGPGNRVIADVIDPSKPRDPWRPNNPSGPFRPIVVSKKDAEDSGDDDFQELMDIIRETIGKAQRQISAAELLGRMSDLSALVQDILAHGGNVSPQDIADVIDDVGDDLDEDDEDVDDLIGGDLKSDVKAVRLGLRLLKGLADKLEDELDSEEPEAPTVGAVGVIAEVVHTYVENTLEDVRKMLKAGSVSKRQVSFGVSKDLNLGKTKLTIDASISTKDFKTANFKLVFKIKF